MALKQANRLLNLATPLGDNELVLTGFDGDEGMSQLFRFTLQMISDNAAIAAKDILGKNVTFSIALADDSPRYFNGFVSRFSAGDEDENGRRAYTAEVVPWLWFLTRNSDSRIFQDMSVPQIVEQIFKDRGFTDYQPKISGSHPKREYCVQHQETDFNFVSRLMEEEGIFYYFEHDNGSHKLILGDKASAYGECSQKEVDYPSDFGVIAIEDHLRSWEHNYEFRTGKFAQTDYNFETPSTSLLTNAKTVMKVPGVSNFEFFEYPGVYGKKGDGQSLADVRMEEEETPHDVVSGAGIVRAFTPGCKFTVRQHRAASEEGKSFVITQLRHVAQESMGYETGGQLGIAYENTFQCIPDKVAYRPPRTTRKPRVQGVQTAIVVGPPGEEIFPDKYGRVKVQFHWDRYGKRDDKSSCWIRVAQVHAGKGFGGIDIPRIGDEVVVSFDDGDPDCPLITGRVYHAENMPPFPLPDSKTISGMKTKTYKGGGYNEMVMDDTPGKELIRVHGQYDMDSTIEHDLREHVFNNRSRDVTVDESIAIGNNQSIAVNNDRSKTVINNETTDVGVDRTEMVGNNESITVGVNRSTQVGSNDSTLVGANQDLSVGANRSVNVAANQSTTVGANLSNAVGASQSDSVGMMRSASVGLIDSANSGLITNLSAGLIMNIAAGVTLTLTGPGGKIVIGPSGIHIKGTMVTIEGNKVFINP